MGPTRHSAPSRDASPPRKSFTDSERSEGSGRGEVGRGVIPPAISFLAALGCAFGVADVTHPPAIFPKYLEAATASAAELAARLGDYSPLYLSFVRLLAPYGHEAVLAAQGLLHAGAAAAVAAAVAALAGGWWGLGVGLAAAAYRPFLVYAGVHEPETAIVFCLAVAILAGARVRALASDAGVRGVAWALLGGLALGAAALLRPQHLLLLPVWALWVGRRRAPAGSLAVLLGGLLLVVPVALARRSATGSLAVMNPGPVFYEGNGPGALGLRRWAPAAVLALERTHPRISDYGHVAYRRIAAAALGRPASPAESNRYWTRLARESLAEWPGRAAARFARKALFALMPYEAHDLVVAEHLDRRLRARLPWGFALLAVALPWAFLARRDRFADLAGPLAVAALAIAVQVTFYASARQRLPLALALLVAAPVLLADLWRRRLGAAVRRPLAVGFGLVVAVALAAASGRWAVLDQREWDAMLGPRRLAAAERLLAVQEGRAGRAALREELRRFEAGLALHRTRRPRVALATLAPLAGLGRDFTIDEQPVGVPEYWMALDLLALGDRARARALLDRALATRPDDPRLLLLAARLHGAPPRRPPGVDPVTARRIIAAIPTSP